MGYFLELREGLTSVLGSTHVVEQLSCSMFLSNLTFDFDLILGSIFTFRGPIVLLVIDSKTVLGSAHVVEQLSFSMFPSILKLDFDLISGSLLTFGGPNGLFCGWGLV